MRPDGAHTHGSRGWDWRIAAIVAIVALCVVPEDRHFLFGGLEAALWCIAGGLTLSVAVLGALVWRSRRRSRADYVRSIHGTTERDRILYENAAARRLVDEIRATRQHQLAMAILQEADMGLIRPDYVRQGTITGRIDRDPGHEALPEPR